MKLRKTKLMRSARPALLMSAVLIGTQAFANELGNPGFESGGGWSVAANHSITTGNARSGSRALRMNSTGGTFTTWSNNIDASEGDEYVLDAYVKAQNLVAGPNGNGDTPILTMRFRDGSDFVRNHKNQQTAGYRWAPWPRGANGTYSYTNAGMGMRFQVPGGGDKIQIGIRTWANNTSGVTHWDDLSLRKLSFPDRGNSIGVYQAENANSINGGFVSSEEFEYTGSGYVDVTRNDAEMTWSNVPGGGQRVISVRYAWEGFLRPLTIILNGNVVASETPMPTGRRGVFATHDFVVNMPNASNTLKLRVGKRGGALGQPMIDKVTLYVKSGTGGGGGGGGTDPQPPATPGNLQASDSTFTNRIAVSWGSSSSADTYQLQRNTSQSGNGAQQIANGPATSTDDTSAEAGTNYYYRVRACNDDGCSGYSSWEQGSRAASGGGGGGGNMGGALSAVISNSQANADISLNAVDFVKLGNPLVRMANTIPQISQVTGLGGTNGFTYNGARVGQQWMNGSPVLTGDNARGGLRVFNNGKGLSVSAPAGTSPSTLSLWMTGKGKSGESFDATLNATLSDNSSAAVSTSITGGSTKFGKLIVLSFEANSDGEQVTVELMKNGGQFMSIDAVSLAGGNGGTLNLPPVIETVGTQTITEGDSLFIPLSATDPEGAEVSFSANGLPTGASVTNSGNGIGSINWQSQIGDAGSFDIEVVAQDPAMNSATQQVQIVVQPLSGGGSGMLDVSTRQLPQPNQTLSGSFMKFAPTSSVASAVNTNGEQPFSDLIRLADAVAARGASSFARYSYNGATPADGSRVRGGNRIFDPAPVGMRLEIDSDTTPESTRLYLGVRDALVRITAALADGSAPQQVITIDHRNKDLATFELEIDHKAGANGQTLAIEGFILEQTAAAPIGFLQFEAVEQ